MESDARAWARVRRAELTVERKNLSDWVGPSVNRLSVSGRKRHGRGRSSVRESGRSNLIKTSSFPADESANCRPRCPADSHSPLIIPAGDNSRFKPAGSDNWRETNTKFRSLYVGHRAIERQRPITPARIREQRSLREKESESTSDARRSALNEMKTAREEVFSC
jgi:hypothetical protein